MDNKKEARGGKREGSGRVGYGETYQDKLPLALKPTIDALKKEYLNKLREERKNQS